jgi:DNA-binding XRE family transcriptional regulator
MIMMLIAQTLTDNEILWLARRRDGLGQTEFAELHGISQGLLSLCEKGKRALNESLQSYVKHNRKKIVKLNPSEIAGILRRRAGDTVQEAGKKVERSRYWVMKAERCEVNPLMLINEYGSYANKPLHPQY